MFSTDERAVRNSVFVIRRTMPWTRLVITASATGSKRSPDALGASAPDGVDTGVPSRSIDCSRERSRRPARGPPLGLRAGLDHDGA